MLRRFMVAILLVLVAGLWAQAPIYESTPTVAWDAVTDYVDDTPIPPEVTVEYDVYLWDMSGGDPTAQPASSLTYVDRVQIPQATLTKGVDTTAPIKDSGGDNTTSTAQKSTGSMTAASGDMVVASANSYHFGTYTITWGNVTSQGTGSYNSDWFDFAEGTPSGDVTITSDCSQAYNAMAAVVIAGESGGGTELTADPITAGSVSEGTPAVGQSHTLSASALSTGPVATGDPEIGQSQVLTATALSSGAAVLGDPNLSQAHGIDAVDVVAGAPDSGTSAIVQSHALTTAGIAAGAPDLGLPILTTSHVLTASPVSMGAPDIETPAIGSDTIEALTPTSVVAEAPTLGSPDIGQVHVVLADSVTTGTSDLDDGVLGQVHNLTSTPTTAGTSDLGSPSLSVTADMIANDLTMGVPTLGSPPHIRGLRTLPIEPVHTRGSAGRARDYTDTYPRICRDLNGSGDLGGSDNAWARVPDTAGDQ